MNSKGKGEPVCNERGHSLELDWHHSLQKRVVRLETELRNKFGKACWPIGYVQERSQQLKRISTFGPEQWLITSLN